MIIKNIHIFIYLNSIVYNKTIKNFWRDLIKNI